MYSILIVEDEKIERESLEKFFTTSMLPFNQVIVAENGEEGLRKYEEYHPDVILADINMPKLGGLEMIEKIRKNDQNITCLILSSYDYFSYAQKAIRLEVEDFILKPADTDMLYNSFTKVVEKLAKNKNTYTQTSLLVQRMKGMQTLLKSECFYAILTKQNEFKLLETFQMANIKATSCICLLCMNLQKKQVLAFDSFVKEWEELGFSALTGNINEKTTAFLIANRRLTQNDYETILSLLTRYELHETKYALGSVQEELGAFYQSYEDAKYNINTIKTNATIHKNSELSTYAQQWSHKFLENYEVNAQTLIHELCQSFIGLGEQEIKKRIDSILESLISTIETKYQLHIEKEDVPIPELNYQNYQSLEIEITQMFNKITKPLKTIRYQNSSYLIKKSMQFIETNYHKAISLNMLAEELGVSPFYVSKLFGKEMQKNFTEIVNDLRINEAKKLIRQDLSLKEVTYKVGFASQSYFTKIFKKSVGMSPKEYRKLFP